MTIDEVESHRFWADEFGNIWERRSYCLEPTATFERMFSQGPEDPCSPGKENSRLCGAIGCMNLSGLKPIVLPEFAESGVESRE